MVIRFGHDYDETCMQMDEVGRRRAAGRGGGSGPRLRAHRCCTWPAVVAAVLTGWLLCTACMDCRCSKRMQARPALLHLHRLPILTATAAARAQPPQILAGTAERMKNFAITYLVDISEVPDFNAMYELYDPCTVMFFFRNKVGVGCNRTSLV